MDQGATMKDNLTKNELQHILTIMNASGPFCELCSRIREKLQNRIAGMPDEEPEFFAMEER
jgi:hypothetical protein